MNELVDLVNITDEPTVNIIGESSVNITDDPPVNITDISLVEKYSKESSIIIQELYTKYQDNPYMLSKMRHLIQNQLSNILDNILKTHEANQQRFEVMSIEKDAFIESFLNNNQYFYNSSTESFFYYDGMHYKYINEDDLLYKILSSISQGRQLMSWKQRTRINIIKRIKENNILKSVPESVTIQFVLDLLYPAFFSSKNEAKHFLTILGDALFKKNTNLFHFIKPNSKKFIQFINEFSNMYFGINVYNSFKHKYHEHEYLYCRMVTIYDSIKNDILWKSLINDFSLDILCIASHYSMRYNSSDDFITNYSNDTELLNNVFYLKDRSQLDIVKQFITTYLQLPRPRSGSFELDQEIPTIEPTINMSWKNMQFLWKHYLNSIGLPTIMFQQTLKQYITEQLKDYYFSEEDLFKGIFSKYLPFIQRFLNFWDETMIEDILETDFEIEEISVVFKKWSISKDEIASQLTDGQIIDIISYYYPTIIIDQDKYLHQIRCAIWDKQMDIQIAINDMRQKLHTQYLVSTTMFQPSANNCAATSIYDMYIYYCKYYSLTQSNVVSKSYFDKYISEQYNAFIVDSNMLSSEWIV